jgi:hypothetical protein
MARTRKLDVGDISAAEAARIMALDHAQFQACLPALLDRGFPPADPTTGNYALDAIMEWRRARFRRLFPTSPQLTAVPQLRDARQKLG